jgi:hypothetical protein
MIEAPASRTSDGWVWRRLVLSWSRLQIIVSPNRVGQVATGRNLSAPGTGKAMNHEGFFAGREARQVASSERFFSCAR